MIAAVGRKAAPAFPALPPSVNETSFAVAIRGVHKRYRTVQALNGVDLEIQRGEFFGLLGPNGAGKSTLINILAGLARMDAGSVAVLGHDVVKDYRQARRVLGVVPQELVYDPFFSVREVLRIQAGYYGLGHEIDPWIEELLQALMLTDKAEANMRSLSGGMKEAEALCERIAILDRGAVIALDNKQALLARGMDSVMLTVLTESPLDRLPAALMSKVKRHQGNELVLQLHRQHDAIADVVDVLRAHGAVITDLHTEKPDLEDVFLELTRRRAQ
jgi:ABC-2 type transport system ATP-binding protein